MLGIQPSEIDRLDMEDYWFWVEAAERKLKRRADELRALYGGA